MRHVTACCGQNKNRSSTMQGRNERNPKAWIGEFQADKEAAQCKDEMKETLRQHTAATERRLGITGGLASRSGLTASPARQVILQIA